MAGHDGTRVIGSASPCGEWQSTPSLRVAKRHGNRGLLSLSGVDVQARLNEMGLGLAVIFVSGESTVQQAVMALDKGALQFLVKPVSRSELLDAVALCMQKELKGRHVRDGCLARLAPREREVLDLLMKGYGNKEVSAKMGISYPTAKQYKGNVMMKLNVETMSQLMELMNLDD